MAGITTTGFDIRTLEEIKTAIETLQKQTIDANINTSAASLLGQINAIFAEQLRINEELQLAVYQSAYPDTASGQALSYIAAITGTLRRAATKATVTVTVNLDDGTVLPAGSAVNVAGDESQRFELIEEFENDTGFDDDFDLEFEASEAGSQTHANAGTLTEIATPVSGWNSATNAADSTFGQDAETDPELRQRREEELRLSGSGTLGAIRADIRNLDSVQAVTVFENTTSVIDANGVPPHSFEAVVLGGDELEIAQQIYDSKPAGIQAFGAITNDIEDELGNLTTIGFSRPTTITTYIDLELDVDDDTYVGDTAVKQALEEFGEDLALGEDVRIADVICVVNLLDGVIDVTSVKVDSISSPVATTNLVIDDRELADIDTANITITTTSV